MRRLRSLLLRFTILCWACMLILPIRAVEISADRWWEFCWCGHREPSCLRRGVCKRRVSCGWEGSLSWFCLRWWLFLLLSWVQTISCPILPICIPCRSVLQVAVFMLHSWPSLWSWYRPYDSQHYVHFIIIYMSSIQFVSKLVVVSCWFSSSLPLKCGSNLSCGLLLEFDFRYIFIDWRGRDPCYAVSSTLVHRFCVEGWFRGMFLGFSSWSKMEWMFAVVVSICSTKL